MAEDASDARFCLSCHQCLLGVRGSACPECGRRFDSNDLRTTSSSASRFNSKALSSIARPLINLFSVLAIAAVGVSLSGMDPLLPWLLAGLLSVVLVPCSLVVYLAALWPKVPLSRWQRLRGIISPLVIATALWTYWPFALLTLPYRGSLHDIADQARAGQAPAFPVRVGPFVVHGADEYQGNIGLRIAPGWWAGTHLVFEYGRTSRVWPNTNWEFCLGGNLHYVYED